MRFRLSTLLLSLALLCTMLGWGISEYRHQTSKRNEIVIVSEMARFQAYIGLSQVIGTATGQQQRDTALLSSVKSLYYLSTLSVPEKREVLSRDYEREIRRLAYQSLSLLEIKSAEEFRKAIIADGELALIRWDAQYPNKRLLVRVLDYETEQLDEVFAEFLTRVIVDGKESDD